MKFFENEYWVELLHSHMGDICMEEERKGMNAFPKWSVEKNTLSFCSPVVSRPSQCVWFSEYNCSRDRKKNNKSSLLETFCIPGEVNHAQPVGCACKVSGERDNFSNSWWNSINSKAEMRESLHKCHHPTFQTNGQRVMWALFFCLNSTCQSYSLKSSSGHNMNLSQ